MFEKELAAGCAGAESFRGNLFCQFFYARFALTGARVPALPVDRSQFSLTSSMTHHLMLGGKSVSAQPSASVCLPATDSVNDY